MSAKRTGDIEARRPLCPLPPPTLAPAELQKSRIQWKSFVLKMTTFILRRKAHFQSWCKISFSVDWEWSAMGSWRRQGAIATTCWAHGGPRHILPSMPTTVTKQVAGAGGRVPPKTHPFLAPRTCQRELTCAEVVSEGSPLSWT